MAGRDRNACDFVPADVDLILDLQNTGGAFEGLVGAKSDAEASQRAAALLDHPKCSITLSRDCMAMA